MTCPIQIYNEGSSNTKFIHHILAKRQNLLATIQQQPGPYIIWETVLLANELGISAYVVRTPWKLGLVSVDRGIWPLTTVHSFFVGKTRAEPLGSNVLSLCDRF